jgi:hypothetical protein
MVSCFGFLELGCSFRFAGLLQFLGGGFFGLVVRFENFDFGSVLLSVVFSLIAVEL